MIADANQLSAGQVGVFMAVTILGGTALQLPVGRLSDRIDRRYVNTGLAVVAVLTSITAITLDSRTPEVIYVTMFLLGGLSFPFILFA